MIGGGEREKSFTFEIEGLGVAGVGYMGPELLARLEHVGLDLAFEIRKQGDTVPKTHNKKEG